MKSSAGARTAVRRGFSARLAALAAAAVLSMGQQVRRPPEIELASGADARVRIEAARRLGAGGGPAGAEALRAALLKERDPRVVDAIVAALAALGAPVSDPTQCGELLARVWDASSAGGLFDCWRASATPEEIDRAALSGSGALQAHALLALAREFASGRTQAGESSRRRLLDSLREVLSGGGRAPSTLAMLHQALWEFSRKNMREAVREADLIPRAESRLAASVFLSEQDPGAYLAARRPKQTFAGLSLAAAFALLAVWPRLRRAGTMLAVAAACWTAWTWVSRDARQLPPLHLSLLTTSFLAILSGGLVTVLIGLLPWAKITTGLLRHAGRIGLAGSCAGILAGLVTLWTRSAGWFPVLQPGWDTIVEPMGALNLGILAGGVFAGLEGLLFRSGAAKEPEPDPLDGLE